jgi:hypothetical protein
MAGCVRMLGCLAMPLKQLLQKYSGPCAATDSRHDLLFSSILEIVALECPHLPVLLTCSVLSSCRTPFQQHSSSWMIWQQQHRQQTHRPLVSTNWQGKSNNCNMCVVHHTLQGGVLCLPQYPVCF